MNSKTNTEPTYPTGGTVAACAADPAGVIDESAIRSAALLAELSEPDALELLEQLDARIDRVNAALEEHAAILGDLSKGLYALHLEHRRAVGGKYGATFHFPDTPVTVARLEQLLDVPPAKAAEILDALLESDLLQPGGSLDVRIDLYPRGATP